MTLAEAVEAVAYYKLRLSEEQANHREFRFETIGKDPEFAAIFERRDKQRHARRSQEYQDRLLDQLEDLE